MRPSFVKLPTPFLCSVITETNPADAVRAIRTSEFDGAQAFLFDLLKLDRQYHNTAELSSIFLSTNKPVMVYYYRRRGPQFESVSDDARADSLLLSVDSGASAVDMMADLFDPSDLELTVEPAALGRQEEFMSNVRAAGGEVMLSSHTLIEMSTSDVLGHVRQMLDREPDMVKIVPRAPTEDALLEAFRTTVTLKRELRIPFIHIVMGEYNRIHRLAGPMLGSALCFCVPYYNEDSTLEQPLLRAMDQVFSNFPWQPPRSVTDKRVGTGQLSDRAYHSGE